MSKEYQGQPGLLDRRVPTALMAGMELTAAMAVMVWMVLTVLLALLVHAVLRVTQDRSVPWVRRGLAGNRVYREPPGEPGPSCPDGFHLEEVEVHQRFPVDQDLPITVCVVDT